MKRLLITGSNGVLGTKLIAEALASYEVMGIDLQERSLNSYLGSFSYQQVDITQVGQVQGVFQTWKPHLVIHAAAFTDVDRAEQEREQCWSVNVQGTQHLAEAARDADAALVYLSTDYVFDGKSGPYGEEDAPHPIGWYARSKYAGEEKVRDILPGTALICRTSSLFGFAPHITRHNFVGFLIDRLKSGQTVQAVADQYVNHTLADDLARIILELISHKAIGIFHTAGNDRLTRYEFAMRLADFFGYAQDLIHPVPASQMSWKAERPLQGGLRLDLLRRYGLRGQSTTEQCAFIQKTYP